MGRISRALAKQLQAPSSHQDTALPATRIVLTQRRKTEKQEQGLASGDHGKAAQPGIHGAAPAGTRAGAGRGLRADPAGRGGVTKGHLLFIVTSAAGPVAQRDAGDLLWRWPRLQAAPRDLHRANTFGVLYITLRAAP